MQATTPAGQPRHYYLDWLRVLAFGLLIFFHTGMFFVSWEWHIKNNQLSEWLELPMIFSSQWRMSQLFIISGAAVFFALRKRTGGSFAGERLKRILLPLAFGMFVVVPPQIYFERLTQGKAFSYWEFYPSVFQFQPYPEGSFSWHHLWYLAYIFVYSLIALPLFLYWKSGKADRMAGNVSRWMGKSWPLWLPTLWLWLGDAWLEDRWPSSHDLLFDWANHFQYFSLFLFGYLLSWQPALGEAIQQRRKVSLTVGVTTLTILYAFFWIDWQEPEGIVDVLYGSIKFINMWAWLLIILGFGRALLNRDSAGLRYANEAVYPFYILHQTIIICLAYPVIHWNLPVGVKFGLISLGTFAVSWLLYEGLIRRFGLFRLLFGLKPKPTSHSVEAAQVRQIAV